MVLKIKIEGMHCAACSNRIEKGLLELTFVEKVFVNLMSRQAVVFGKNLNERIIFETIKKLGYRPKEAEEEVDEDEIDYKNYFWVALLFTVPVFIISMFHIHFAGSGYVQLVLTTVVLGYSGRYFFIGAFNLARRFASNMDTLISIGAGAAYIYSVIHLSMGSEELFFETAAVIITLILYGKFVESKVRKSARESLDSLKVMKSTVVTKMMGEQEIVINLDDLQESDLIKIRPGDSIPIDGKIIEGTSEVDESFMTGEFQPVIKTEGDRVVAGSVNLNSVLIIMTEKVGSTTFLASILKSTEEAQWTKPRLQRIADKISSVFVPVVLVISLLTLLGTIFLTNNVTAGIMSGIAVLVISCPCALGLATPIAIQISVGNAAKKGLVVKSVETLEIIHTMKSLVFDKTGTLTEGKPKVSECIILEEDHHFLEYIYALESNSEHPLGKAITTYLKDRGVTGGTARVKDFKIMVGQGIAGTIDDHLVVEVVNFAYALKHFDMMEIGQDQLNTLKEENQTIVIAAINKKPVTLFGLEDNLRERSLDYIQGIMREGIEPILCTGDTKYAAAKIAKKTGIKEVYAEMMPDEKRKIVAKYKVNGPVGMVGDGINDAPALAEADVSFAIGTGTDIAMHSAQMTLLKPDLSGVLYAIRLSKKTTKIIKQNLFLAFVYNVIAIPFAALGFLHPMAASLAMLISSVCVVTNSLRLRNI